jgi:hypothetical protein
VLVADPVDGGGPVVFEEQLDRLVERTGLRDDPVDQVDAQQEPPQPGERGRRGRRTG